MSSQASVDVLDTETLVLKVREYTAIYDPNDKNYCNRSYIASVWKKIGNELCVTGAHAKKKWHQLRSNYMRVKRYEKSKGKSKNKWPYYEVMAFLDEFSESRDTSNNIQEEVSQQLSPFIKCEVEDLGIDLPDDNVVASYENETTSLPTVKKKKSTKTEDCNLQYFCKSKKVNSCRFVPRLDENDPDRMFLLSLLPSVQQLTPADNMDFKLVTLQFLKSKLNLTQPSDNICQHEQCHTTQSQKRHNCTGKNFESSGSSRCSSGPPSSPHDQNTYAF